MMSSIKISLTLFLLLVPGLTLASISYDTSGAPTAQTNTSGSDSVTVANDDSAICVMVLGDTTTDYVTDVSLGATSLTQIDKNHPAGDRWNYMYYGAGISAGTYNLVITKSSSSLSRPYYSIYSGVDSGSPDATASVKNHGASTSYQVTVTTVTDDAWVCGGYNDVGGSTDSDGTGTTIRASSSGRGIADNGGPKSPAGAVTLTINSDTSLAYDFYGVAMKPLSETPTTTPSTSTTQTVDNPVQDLFYGYILFMTGLLSIIWIMRGRKTH